MELFFLLFYEHRSIVTLMIDIIKNKNEQLWKAGVDGYVRVSMILIIIL